jgi:hypothetical protein
MPDTEISKLPPLSLAQLQADDVLAIADVSLVETKKVRADDLVSAGINRLSDGSVDPNKIDWDGFTAPITLPAGSVTTVELADGSVTTEKIADGAVSAIKISSVNGSAIADRSITAEKVALDAVGRGIDIDADNIGIANSVIAGQRNGIAWNEQGLITGDVALTAGDLPAATDTQIGGVSVPAGSGLSVSPLGALDHASSIPEGGGPGFLHDEHGHIVATSPLVSTDLPVATSTEIGAVSIPTDAASPLIVDAGGAVTHKGVTGGAQAGLASVDIDAYGHVVAGSGILSADQVPGLDASKIVTGEFVTARLAENSITAQKMADYSTCLMQEEFPGFSSDYFLGMLWWQPSTSQLRVYARGSSGTQWSPVGFGALQANNLRWGGTFNADTGVVSIVTSFGATAGLTAGTAIPAPTDDLSGLYLICQTEGSNVPQPDVASDTFTPGDWLLCINEAEGYVHIDAGSTGGGGGGSSYLSSLLDVDVATAKEGDRLEYKSTGIWKNSDLIDGGDF